MADGMTQARIGIIGAGMSGLGCAGALRDAGLRADVFDKGQFPGGRVCTRVEGDLSWDHGAQFFRAHDTPFQRGIDRWVDRGIVSEWFSAGTDHEFRRSYIGLPSMRAFAQHLAEGLDIRCGVTVTNVERHSRGFRVRGLRRGSRAEEELGDYERVVVTAPAPQAIALFPELAERLSKITYRPCWALMLEYPSPLDLPGVLRRDGGWDMLGFAQREGDKPGRSRGRERWLVHMAPEFSARKLEATPEEAIAEAFEFLAQSWYRPLTEPVFARAHRWRYARVQTWLGKPFILSDDLGVCGDGMLGSRVESAFESGRALGEALAHGWDSHTTVDG